MNFSQLFGQLASQLSQPKKLVNFRSTLVNHDSNNSMKSASSVVDQILKHDQRTVELTTPPCGGSQLVNSRLLERLKKPLGEADGHERSRSPEHFHG